jgi:hypothetical protein
VVTRVAPLHAAVKAALKAAAHTPDGEPSITVYDGEVNAKPPTDSGGVRVLPYWVLWGGAGRPARERSVIARELGGDAWSVSITTAAGTPVWVLGAVDVLRAAMAELVLPGGGQLSEEVEGPRSVLRDPDIATPRFYLPLTFTALLP